MLQQLVSGQAADTLENEANSISLCTSRGSAKQRRQKRELSLGKEPIGAPLGEEPHLGLSTTWGRGRCTGVSAGGAPCPRSALTPAPLRLILSPTSDSSCLTAHSNPAQQFQQESEEACIQLKLQGGFREAEGNFPSWNMARIQGLISWLLGKQSWDLCSMRVILISFLSQIWEKRERRQRE